MTTALNANAREFYPEDTRDFQPIMSQKMIRHEFNGATYVLGSVAPYVFRYDTFTNDEGSLAVNWVLVGEADLIDDDGEPMIYDVFFYEGTEEYSLKMKMIEEEDEEHDRQLRKLEETDDDYLEM
jgi:hypothetical protein